MNLARAAFVVGAAASMAACGGDRGTASAASAAPSSSSGLAAPADASGAAASAPASSGAAVSSAVAGTAPFTCFGWAHLDAFSTDCYRTRAECDASREAMIRGARHPSECRDAATASCTMLSDATDPKPPTEHCFGDVGNCGRYRGFIAGGIAKDRLRTTECAER